MGVELPPPVTAVSLPAEAQTTSSSATPPWIASWPIGMLFRERLQNVAQGTSTSTPGTIDATNGGDLKQDPADGDTD